MRTPALHRALALVLLVGASGCLEPRADREPGVQGETVLLPIQCTQDPSWAPCRNSTPTEYVVEGLLLSRTDPSFTAGVWVNFLDKDLTLRNMTIQGFDSGIVVHNTQCASCTLRLENVTLIGTSSTDRSTLNRWPEPAGVEAVRYEGDVYGVPNLQTADLRIEGFPIGIVWSTSEGDNTLSIQDAAISCIHHGMWLAAHRIIVEGGSVEGCRGFGLRSTGTRELTVEGPRLERNWQGLVAWGRDNAASIRISNSTFEANEVGGVHIAIGAAKLSGNAFTANGAAPDRGAYKGLETDVVHAAFVAYGSLEMRANCIQGNPGWGAATIEGAIDVVALNADGNWWGSEMGPRRGNAAGGGYTPPQPLLPVGDGDLVPYDLPISTFLTQPPASCSLLN
jgi:parallel beta helix pectate lyase-like protein